MTVRNIKKSLAGTEDLALGIGTLAQERGTVHRVNVFPSSYNYIDMQQYKGGDFFRLYGSDMSYTDYRRNPTGTVGIPAGAGGVWEPLTSNDKIIGGNTIDGAYLVDETYLVWHAASGRNYAWSGTFPKQVTPGSTLTPLGSGGWIARSDETLRSDLASTGGAGIIGTSDGRTVQGRLDALPNEVDAAGTAAHLIEQHDNDAFAHPQLSSFITAEANRAQAEANRAQVAADAASLSGDVYPDTASGLAATTNGEYFSVVSPAAEGYLDLYRNNSGVAAYQKTYPSSALVKRLDDGFNKLTGDNGLSIDGSDGQSSIELKTGDAKALVVGTHSTEMMMFDTISKKVNVPASDLADATVSKVIHLSDSEETESENTEDMITSTRAKVIGGGKHSLTFDTVNGELISTFKFVDKSQNVGIVLDNDIPEITDGVPSGYELSSRLYQGTATIARAGNRFWLAWRADKNVAAEAPGNFFVIGYSDDNCATVTETNVVKFSNDNHQIVDPMLWANPETGELWLFWGSFGKAQAQDGICGCWCSVLENPLASIKPTWSRPFKYRNIGDPRRPVRIAGKWVQCIDMWRSDAAFPPVYPDTAGCEFVEFNPLTKSTINIGHNSPNNPSGGGTYSGFFETEIVQLTGGRLMSTTRGLTGSELQRTFSYDNGKTWTAQENYSVLFPASSSRIWLGKTPTGRLLVAYNNDLVRRTLTIKLSEDEGETFPYSVILEGAATPETVSYPIVAFDGDDIYTAYDYGRGTANEIRVTTVKESEIILGTATPIIHIVSGPTP